MEEKDRKQVPYQIKVGDMVVNIEYSDNDKSFYECMLNILKRKQG